MSEVRVYLCPEYKEARVRAESSRQRRTEVFSGASEKPVEGFKGRRTGLDMTLNSYSGSSMESRSLGGHAWTKGELEDVILQVERMVVRVAR